MALIWRTVLYTDLQRSHHDIEYRRPSNAVLLYDWRKSISVLALVVDSLGIVKNVRCKETGKL